MERKKITPIERIIMEFVLIVASMFLFVYFELQGIITSNYFSKEAFFWVLYIPFRLFIFTAETTVLHYAREFFYREVKSAMLSIESLKRITIRERKDLNPLAVDQMTFEELVCCLLRIKELRMSKIIRELKEEKTNLQYKLNLC